MRVLRRSTGRPSFMSVSVLPAQLGQDSQGCRHTVVARPDSAPFTITVVQNTVAVAYANDAPESSCCPTLLIRFEVVAGPFAANFDERNRPLSIQDAKALYAAAEAPGGQCEAQRAGAKTIKYDGAYALRNTCVNGAAMPTLLRLGRKTVATRIELKLNKNQRKPPPLPLMQNVSDQVRKPLALTQQFCDSAMPLRVAFLHQSKQD